MIDTIGNPALWKTAGLLVISNIFMTFAWYGHLRDHQTSSFWFVLFSAWGLAFFEYLVMIPANRIGYGGGLTLPQLKIMQEVIALSVFLPFLIFYMKREFDKDYIYAGICLLGAIYFIFRQK